MTLGLKGLPTPLLFAMALLAVLGRPAVAQVEWVFGGINPPDAPVTVASEQFAAWVTERTEGRVVIRYFGGSQLGSGPEQIEAMSAGAQQGYISAGSNASKLVKEFGVVDTAFLFHDQAHFLAFQDSDMAAELQQRLIDEYGVRVLATNWFRLPRAFVTRDGFVTGPEDIAGKRARSPNLPMYYKSWELIGTIPVKTAYSEAYLAISQGLVDMTESAGEQIYTSKYYELLPYVTEAEMMYPQNSVYVAEDAWQAIGEDDRQIIREAAFEAGEFFTQLVMDRVGPWRAEMEAAGTQFAPLSDEARAEFRAMVAARVPELVADGLMPEGWWDRIQALRE